MRAGTSPSTGSRFSRMAREHGRRQDDGIEKGAETFQPPKIKVFKTKHCREPDPAKKTFVVDSGPGLVPKPGEHQE